MVKNIKSNLLFILVILVFFGWYLYQLTNIPVFADEAIYLNWAKRVITGQENLFISVSDGKPPLFIWLAGLTSLIFKNLLFAGRLVSILSLFTAAILVFKRLVIQSKPWAYLSLIFILGSPFLFFHSRLALLDALFASLLIIAIFLWHQSKSLLSAAVSGLFIGLAFWAKTPALFLLPFPLLSKLLNRRQSKIWPQVIIAGLVSVGMILSLRVSVWFPALFNRSQDFSFTIMEVLQGQTSHFTSNLGSIIRWLSFYQPWPILILAILAIYKGIKSKEPLVIDLTLALLLFFLPIWLIGKALASRYFLFLGFPLAILAAYNFKSFKNNLAIVIAAGFLGLTFYLNYQFQINYFAANLPKEDNSQYFQDWSSGIGLPPVSKFINEQAQTQKVKVLTEGTFGTLPDGLFIYQSNYPPVPNLEIIGVGSPTTSSFQKELLNTSADLIYYVGNQNRLSAEFKETHQLISQYEKKDNGPALAIYLLKNTND